MDVGDRVKILPVPCYWVGDATSAAFKGRMTHGAGLRKVCEETPGTGEINHIWTDGMDADGHVFNVRLDVPYYWEDGSKHLALACRSDELELLDA